jgi:hypothetical protein
MSSLVTAAPMNLASRVEAALIEGDLGKLSVEEKLKHYMQVCESLGLNPHTKPFGYILLQGKVTLYALRACTDQLRTIHGVSVVSVQTVAAGGLVTVTATVRDKTGREDSDIGCVSVDGLRGEMLANAHMKAITKAKRRATLSLCGLGWLDETEAETIPSARIIPEPAAPLAIAKPVEQPKPAPAPKPVAVVPVERMGPGDDMEPELATEAQLKELTRLKKAANFTPAEQAQWGKMVREDYGVDSPKELSYEAAETIIDDLKALTATVNGGR